MFKLWAVYQVCCVGGYWRRNLFVERDKECFRDDDEFSTYYLPQRTTSIERNFHKTENENEQNRTYNNNKNNTKKLQVERLTIELNRERQRRKEMVEEKKDKEPEEKKQVVDREEPPSKRVVEKRKRK